SDVPGEYPDAEAGGERRCKRASRVKPQCRGQERQASEEHREQHRLGSVGRPFVEAVGLLEDRKTEGVRVELAVHEEGRADDEVKGVCGGCRERNEVHATSVENERRADEEQRRDVAEIPALESGIEG